jgi:WD40 repeat protein
MRWPISSLLTAVVILIAVMQLHAQELQRRHVLRAYKEQVEAVAVSRDGTTAASLVNWRDTRSSDRQGEFRVWDTASGKRIAMFHAQKAGGEDVFSIALSPNGKRMATATQSGRLELWSIAEQRVIRSHQLRGLNAILAFSADGRKLGMATADEILICDGETGANAKTVERRSNLYGAAFSPDLRWLVSFYYQDADFLDTATGKLERTLPDHPGSVNRLAFSADGKKAAATVATYDDAMNYLTEIVVWDGESAKRSAHLKGIGVCMYATFAVDDRHLALLAEPEFRSNAFALKIVDLPNGKTSNAIRFPREQRPWCAAGSGDGRILAVGCRDGSVQVFAVK